jgi:hypothetical protein
MRIQDIKQLIFKNGKGEEEISLEVFPIENKPEEFRVIIKRRGQQIHDLIYTTYTADWFYHDQMLDYNEHRTYNVYCNGILVKERKPDL